VVAKPTFPPLVVDRHVALVGRRDHDEPWYGHAALEASSILDLPGDALRRGPLDAIVPAVLAQAAGPEADGFWVHLDADLLSPAIMPAVDSPIAGGPLLEEAVALLGPLVRHPNALGFELTIYDPSLDPTRAAARTLVTLLARAFRETNSGSRKPGA
jgi:arginase